MPKEAEVSITSVGRWIADHEHDPRMRVKALHDWVADRVAYDGPSYMAHRIPWADGDAQSVFRTRVGVCAGYAQLLAALGKVTGDEILYIVGDSRSEDAPMEGESHAWNAAKIDGQWTLIDVTWDAGHLEGGVFAKRYRTDYLFTPPQLFGVTHFPDLAKWQLLETPLSRAEFFRRPVLAPAFFTHRLDLVTPDRSQVAAGAAVDVRVSNPENAWLLVDYHPKGGGRATKCAGDQHTAMRCSFAAAGTYDVDLYVNDQQFGTYAYAGSVEVNARP
jgi:transglutaminase/protease-like cytokinesis protein 3